MELGEPSGLLYEDIYGEGGRARTRSCRPLSILLKKTLQFNIQHMWSNAPAIQPSTSDPTLPSSHPSFQPRGSIAPGRKNIHTRVCVKKTVSTPKEPRERILMGTQQVFACRHAMKLKKYPECRKPYLCKLALV